LLFENPEAVRPRMNTDGHRFRAEADPRCGLGKERFIEGNEGGNGRKFNFKERKGDG
jgi:hypothetical protein